MTDINDKQNNLDTKNAIESLNGFKHFYDKFMNVYGREGYIDSNYTTINIDKEKFEYTSPIKSASVIKLKNCKKLKVMSKTDNEPQTKSPKNIPKSTILDSRKTSKSFETSEILTNKRFKELEPLPRIKRQSMMKQTGIIKQNELLSHDISIELDKNNNESKVVVFEKKQMKQFLLSVWGQVTEHIGAINTLKQKLSKTSDVSDFKKKSLKKNSYGIPIYEKIDPLYQKNSFKTKATFNVLIFISFFFIF